MHRALQMKKSCPNLSALLLSFCGLLWWTFGGFWWTLADFSIPLRMRSDGQALQMKNYERLVSTNSVISVIF